MDEHLRYRMDATYNIPKPSQLRIKSLLMIQEEVFET